MLAPCRISACLTRQITAGLVRDGLTFRQFLCVFAHACISHEKHGSDESCRTPQMIVQAAEPVPQEKDVSQQDRQALFQQHAKCEQRQKTERRAQRPVPLMSNRSGR
jgi:hypothetical protein